MREGDMMKDYMEDEVLEIIAEQIKLGYYSGMFDVLDDNTDKYITVNWDLNVESYEND